MQRRALSATRAGARPGSLALRRGGGGRGGARGPSGFLLPLHPSTTSTCAAEAGSSSHCKPCSKRGGTAPATAPLRPGRNLLAPRLAASSSAAAAAKAAEEEEQRRRGDNGTNGNGTAEQHHHAAANNSSSPNPPSLAAAISAAAADGADVRAAQSRRELLEAATAAANAAAPPPPPARVPIRGLAHAVDIFYRFSRPHTMIGTFLSVISVSAMALPPAPAAGAPLGGILADFAAPGAGAAIAAALSAALCANVAIVGLNQLYDVEIDQVNKPYLPLASGELSLRQGWLIVGATAALSLALAAASGSPPLLATVGGSLLLGLVYSTELPFMRWKRSPVLAAACILAVRAVAVQLGFFLHVKHAVAVAAAAGAAAAAAPPVVAAAAASGGAPLVFAVSFMALFSVVIALFKDLPDVAGDKANGIATFSVRFGTPRVFACCVAILAAAYAGGALYGLDMARRALLLADGAAAASSSSFSFAGLGAAAAAASSLPPALAAKAALPGALVAAGHAVMGAALVRRSALEVDTSSPASLARHYMWVWKLFYAEYLLLPLLR
jgi:homogentisate phytyltransferase / homogentisate geranylgeranyltransferase